MPERMLKTKVFTSFEKASSFHAEQKHKGTPVTWKTKNGVHTFSWYAPSRQRKNVAVHKYAGQPGYVLRGGRWHSFAKLRRELVKPQRFLKDPVVYHRVAWKSEDKINVAEVKTKLKGRFTESTALVRGREQLEKYSGRLPAEPIGESPGLVFIGNSLHSVKSVWVDDKSRRIKYHYKPQSGDILFGQGIKNLSGWG